MANDSTGILAGTLDLLILETVSSRRLHGYGVQQMTQGAPYPALYRLERQALLDTELAISDRNRKARFDRLTQAGRKRLREQTEGWNRMVGMMEAASRTCSGEIS